MMAALCTISADPLGAQAQTQARVGVAGDGQSLEVQRRILFQHMMADPSNLDVAFEYAALSARAGDLEGAIATLERMLIFAPGLPRLQLELGVLYYRLASYDTAAAYFEAAVSGPDVPEEVRLRVQQYQTGIARESAPTRLSGVVAFGARYQTNANAAPENRLVSLNGIDFLLDEGSVSAPDVNGFIAGNVRFSHDLESQGDRLEATLTTYAAAYADRNELNTAIAEVTAGPVFNMERFRISDTTLGIYGIAGGVILAEDPYLLSGGVGVNLVNTSAPATRISLRTEYRYEEYRDTNRRPMASDRTGTRLRGEAEILHQVAANFALVGSLEAERRHARDDALSSVAFGAAIGGRLSLLPPLAFHDAPWTLGLTVGYLRRDYDEPDGIGSTTEAQRDREAFVEASLAVPVADAWAFVASGGYRNVDSNYDMKKFDNVSGTLTLMRQF